MANKVIAAVTAQNTWTDSFDPFSLNRSTLAFTCLAGQFNLFIYGTFVATVTLQKSFDGTTWIAMATTYTAPGAFSFTELEKGVVYRVGVATGDFTSGTANLRLSN